MEKFVFKKTDKEAKFDEFVKRMGFTKEQAEAVAEFVSEAESNAYQEGCDAESYSNAMSYMD
jgi:hypothetical protein